MPSANFYSVAQAARRLGMTEGDAVRAIAAAGVRPATTSPRVLFRCDDIDDLFLRIGIEMQRNRKREDELDAGRHRMGGRMESPEEAMGSSSGLFDLLEASKASDDDDDRTLLEQVRAAAKAAAEVRLEDDSAKHTLLPVDSSSGMFDCVRPEDLRDEGNRG